MLGRAFPPAPVRSPAGHALAYAETERRLEPLLDRVPITRVYDATALDRLGLPVWAAVTPLARDLTVHAGKGPTPAAARISAIMEAIERVCAEAVDPARIRRASYETLSCCASEAVLDPEACDLPFGTGFAPARECGWVLGHDLLTDRPTWVALDLVISPAAEGICQGVETNGLAAGNLEVEAILHGLLEVIERDAAAHDRFGRRFAEDDAFPALRLIEPRGLPRTAARWCARLRRADLEVTIQDLRHDLGLPVFRVILSDSGFPGREGAATLFQGFGCALDAGHALTRAISEAVQAHTVMLVGAREAFEGDPEPPTSLGRLLQRLGGASSVGRFSPTPREEVPGDLAGRLELVLARLLSAGLERCVVVDLTRPELGIPVVRVIVPGAAAPFGESARRPADRLLRMLAP